MATVIALPHASAEAQNAVKLPAAPSQPPTVKDITNSAHYSTDILTAHARKRATDEDVAEAELYRNKLLSTRAGGEPAWFAAAMDRALAPIRADIQTLKDDVQTLKDDVRDMKLELADNKRISARIYNMSASTGDGANFEIVPFPNGQNPTKGPHNLPPLKCVSDIKALSANRRDQYYRGYYSVNGAVRLPPINERMDKIFLAIGAKDI